MNDQMMKLNKNNNGDYKITHNILMMDDEFGECKIVVWKYMALGWSVTSYTPSYKGNDYFIHVWNKKIHSN